jgi:TRAP-type C4-dicarboxylate transport system permease small subunit
MPHAIGGHPMVYFERLVRLLSVWCDRIAQGAVVGMMLIVGGNILLRFFGKPILGTYDWTGLLATILIALSLGYCGVLKGHVRVEFILARFPQRVQAVVDSITGMLSLGLFALAVWQSVVLGNEMWRKGEVSITVKTPFYPFVYAIAFGCALLWLVIFVETMKSLAKAVRG